MAEPFVRTLRHLERCLGCYSQDPGRRYVDMGSLADGPLEVVPEPSGGTRLVSHDVVVLCGLCVERAANLLPEVAEHRERLRAERDEAQKTAKQWRDHAVRVENAIAERPEPKTRKRAA